MKQLITALAASGKTINKDSAFWAKYYLENPGQLADFITIANDTARRLAAEVERLEAENERLREALQKIADKSQSWEGRSDVPFWNLGDIARAALKGKR